MVYQDKICTVQFMKSFSTSLPNSRTVQSKYELAFGDTIVEGLSIQPQLSPEFIERLRRKIPKQKIVASVHLNTLPQWKIILGEKIDKHKYLLGSCTWASGQDAELWNLVFTPVSLEMKEIFRPVLKPDHLGYLDDFPMTVVILEPMICHWE